MDDVPPAAADASTELEGVLRLSRAQESDAVVVVGPHALDTALGLYRRGFTHVTCVGGGECTCVAEPGDHLFVGGPMSDARLVAVLAHTVGHLNAGGVLVARLTGVDQDRVLEACLARMRREVGSTVSDGARGGLVPHHVTRGAPRARAA